MGIVDYYYPETTAGGFTRNDEAIELYSRINALITPASVVIDLGAGRGERFHGNTTNAFSLALCRLQGKVGKLIGIDVDDAIANHPHLDERHVVEFDQPLPVASASADLILSEWVLEHVEDSENFAREVDRVLAPGGWFCALTPNANGYVGLTNRILSSTIKTRLLSKVWPGRNEIDVFPTHYRLNSSHDLERLFPSELWEHCSYYSNPAPKYHGDKSWAFRLIELYQGLVPNALKTNMMIFIRKREGTSAL